MHRIAAGHTTSSSTPWEPKDLRRARPGKREPKRSMRTLSTWMTRSPCCPRSPWPTEGSRTVRAGETALRWQSWGGSLRVPPTSPAHSKTFAGKRGRWTPPIGSTACAATSDTCAARRSPAISSGPLRHGGVNSRSPSTFPSPRRTRATSLPPSRVPRMLSRIPPASCACPTRDTQDGRRQAHRVHIRRVKISVSSPSSSEMRRGGSNTAPTRISTSTASR